MVISADLIINQDNFWDKIGSDNGNFTLYNQNNFTLYNQNNFNNNNTLNTQTLNINTLHNSNTLTTLNHNSTPAYRNRNNLSSAASKQLPTYNQLISSSSTNQFINRKNPLLNSSKLMTLIK